VSTCGKEERVQAREPRTPGLSLKDLHLVTKDEDLRFAVVAWGAGRKRTRTAM